MFEKNLKKKENQICWGWRVHWDAHGAGEEHPGMPITIFSGLFREAVAQGRGLLIYIASV